VEGTFKIKIRTVILEKTEGDIQRHLQLSELKSLSCTDSEQIPELWSTRYLHNCSSLCLEPLAKTQTAPPFEIKLLLQHLLRHREMCLDVTTFSSYT